jgi:putative ABC transport system permease protein
MRIIGKLVLAQVGQHPGRMILTSLAIMAAACVVVWVVSGYDALVGQFDSFASDYLGRYDLIVLPEVKGVSDIPQLSSELVNEMSRDPAVAEINPVMQIRARITNPNLPPEEQGPFGLGGPPGSPAGGAPGGNSASGASRHSGGAMPPGAGQSGGGGGRAGGMRRGMMFGRMPSLVGTTATLPPYKMIKGDWINPASPDRMEGVLSGNSAEALKVNVGDEMSVTTRMGEFRVKIVGIISQAAQQPTLGQRGSGPGPMRGPAMAALYVPMALAEKISGTTGQISFVNVVLKEGVDPQKFIKKWTRPLAKAKPPALMVDLRDVKTGMEEGFSASRARNQAYSATGLSLMASLFIIFTTLSMGVNERIRQLAMMRAVAMTRAQVAGLIIVESLVLALLGWAGGLAAGWGLLKIMTYIKPELFLNGASLGVWCVILSGLCAFGGALAASILPAWRATRVSPLDAMAPPQFCRVAHWPVTLVIAGLLLIAVNPLLVFSVPMSDDARYGIYMALGCTSMAIGFVLFSPLAIILAEKIFSPIIAPIMGVEHRLLSTQLSSNLWRTVGTTVALSIGLGLFVAMQTWGYTMLGPFLPGDWAPDLLVSFQSGGLPEAEIENVRHIKGVIAEQCLPLAVEQPRLAEDITKSEEHSSVTRQDNVIMIGLDPEAGLGGPNPLLKLKFTEGNRDDAIARLKQDRCCIVPDHFSWATGLHVGDSFKVLQPEAPEKPVEYKIAGVVSLPGWHWMTKFSGLRKRSGRSAAMVFANYNDVKDDFQIKKVNFFWMNLEKDLPNIVEYSSGSNNTFYPVVKNPYFDCVGAALQTIADKYLGEQQPVNQQGRWGMGAKMFGSSARLTTGHEIRGRITARADGMIWGMSQLPLITLLVTSLGVVNAVMASIRARRWEMGVMRAVGITRWGLFRLILAEAVLIGLVACLLSFAFGVTAGWCGVGISRYVSFFGGMATPLVVPWTKLALGFAATLLLCLAAALWPAFTTGRTEPLKLLQAGRAAM